MARASRPSKIKGFFRAAPVRFTVKLVIAAVVAASLFLNLYTYVTPVVRYFGTSMAPTLSDGQILVVCKPAAVHAGDLVAFYYNNSILVRRVVATGNQQVAIDIFGNVSVNGEVLDEPYAADKTLGQCDLPFPYNVPANSYFVLGDDRDSAMDSRLADIGAISEDQIVGKVILSLNPLKTIS